MADEWCLMKMFYVIYPTTVLSVNVNFEVILKI